MPLRYVVPSDGQVGPALRAARGDHTLRATGPSAWLGSFLPHTTSTITTVPNGHPLEAGLSFALALWLTLGCVIPSEDVLTLFVYEHMVGAERLGTALDMMINEYTDREGYAAVSPSVLQRFCQTASIRLRKVNVQAFTVTPSYLLIVGGTIDDLDCATLPTPLECPALLTSWCAHLTFGMLLSPNGTLAVDVVAPAVPEA